MKFNSCAFTGHRRMRDDLDMQLLEKSIRYLIEECGVNVFYNGMARGFDLIAARTVIELKKTYRVRLIACIPCKGQERSYSAAEQAEYADILENCDEVRILSEQYYGGCMLRRDRYMVENADVILAYLREESGGTFYTVSYARQKEKHLMII